MYKAFVDGACRPNPGQGAYSYVVFDLKDRIVAKGSGSAGSFTTNNAAEYFAMIKVLESALEKGLNQITVFSDNQVVVRQLSGVYAINSEKLVKLKKKVDQLKKSFESIQFIYIRRERNRFANQITQKYFDEVITG